MRVTAKFWLDQKAKAKNSFIRSDCIWKGRGDPWMTGKISFCFLSEPVSMFDDFSSVSFTFVAISGFYLTPDSLGYVADIYLAKNEIAITVQAYS